MGIVTLIQPAVTARSHDRTLPRVAYYSFLPIVFAVSLSACVTDAQKSGQPDPAIRFVGETMSIPNPAFGQVTNPIGKNDDERNRTHYVELANADVTGAIAKKTYEVDKNGQQVSLNFVDAPVQEFVRVVFDEVLKEPVVIDASLKGSVTIRTQSPVSRDVAIELVRQALQANGASLVRSGEAYRISARADSKGNRRMGESVRVLPLRYITADEAKSALSAFGQSGVDFSIGPNGQFIVLSGSAFDLDNIEQALAVLDVDQMKGTSFGLFPLREAAAGALANELNQMFGRPNDLRLFRALPIDRMNAVLVMASHAQLLSKARAWLTRLDQADRDGRKIYVYTVQNRRAPDIAKIISAVIDTSGKGKQPDIPPAPVSPQLTPSTGAMTKGPSSLSTFSSPRAGPDYTSSISENDSDKKTNGPRVTADAATNSIVVTANVEEWRVIQSALRRLDVMAPQVLIEATIAEVTLNNTLSHGVRWYFEQGNHSTALVASDGTGASSPFGPGFNYAFGVPKAKVVLNALEQITDVNVISSPALTVLDNQTARLQVGDQVPIITRSAVSVAAPDAPVVSDIEMKDTGVILAVTPRVNASGLVVLEIMQEVSEVVPTTSSSLDSPTIRQRRLNSSVAVYSGMDIVLGGLISTSRNRDDNGVPLVMEIPVIGNLFKSDAKKQEGRTELLVILRPTVMARRADIKYITDEIEARMARILRQPRH